MRARVRRVLDVLPKLGLRYCCPFCHLRFRRLEPRGRDLPVYAELGIVGGGLREAECPWCRSNDRERLLYLFLRRHTDLFSRPLRVLHVAPEARLRRLVAGRQRAYETTDLDMPGVDFHSDLTAIPRPDGAYDAIICSHVLEHVSDDRLAMQELHRVLSPAASRCSRCRSEPGWSGRTKMRTCRRTNGRSASATRRISGSTPSPTTWGGWRRLASVSEP